MLEEDDKILKYNHGEKSMNVLFIVCADLESLLKKITTCHNNSKHSSTTIINKHIPCDYSLFAQCSFDATKKKGDCYRGKDMAPLINEEKKYIEGKKFITHAKKDLVLKMTTKNNHKVRDHCHYTAKHGAAHDICNLRYKITKEIPVVFHNGSIYDYHFIIKELVKEFER